METEAGGVCEEEHRGEVHEDQQGRKGSLIVSCLRIEAVSRGATGGLITA